MRNIKVQFGPQMAPKFSLNEPLNHSSDEHYFALPLAKHTEISVLSFRLHKSQFVNGHEVGAVLQSKKPTRSR
jgi:hypothetical protein